MDGKPLQKICEMSMDAGSTTISLTLSYNEIRYNTGSGISLATITRTSTTQQYQCVMYAIFPKQAVITSTGEIKKIDYPAIYTGAKSPVIASSKNTPTLPEHANAAA